MCSAEQPGKKLRLARPSFLQHISRYSPGGIAQRESDDDDIVERADDRQELGDEIDRREDPESGEYQGNLRATGNPGSRRNRQIVLAHVGRNAARSLSTPRGRVRARTMSTVQLARSVAALISVKRNHGIVTG